jgi:hypothetical protein
MANRLRGSVFDADRRVAPICWILDPMRFVLDPVKILLKLDFFVSETSQRREDGRDLRATKELPP